MAQRSVERVAVEDLKTLIMAPTKEFRPLWIQLDKFGAVPFSVGNGTLRIENFQNLPVIDEEDENYCIVITVNMLQLNLEDYYHSISTRKGYDRERDCPTPNHEQLFQILDFLSVCFDLPVHLNDVSTKSVNHCTLMWSLMRLRSKVSFYERFGWIHLNRNENEAFYKALEEVPINKIVKRGLRNLKEMAVADGDPSPFDPSESTVHEFAVWVHDACEKNLPFTNTPEFRTALDTLHEFVKNFRQKLKLKQTFYRPRSNRTFAVNKYAVSNGKDGAADPGFYFAVRTLVTGGKRRPTKRTFKLKRKRVQKQKQQQQYSSIKRF